MENVKKKRGRPSRFRPEFAEKARTLAEFGATREEIAEFFDVDSMTLSRWSAKDPAFADAIRTGAARADERVVDSLYQQAVGFTRDEEIVHPGGNEGDHQENDRRPDPRRSPLARKQDRVSVSIPEASQRLWIWARSTGAPRALVRRGSSFCKP